MAMAPRTPRIRPRPKGKQAEAVVISAPSMELSVFRSAIENAEGNGVDAGYLAMFWALIGWSVGGIVILVIAVLSAYVTKSDHAQIIQSTGVALGAIATGFAAVLGAVGLFRMGDKPRPTTTIQTSQQSKTTVEQPS